MAGFRIPQSVAYRAMVKAYLSSDHVSPATGKTIAVVISKNGGAFANPSAGATNATEVGNGWYYADLSTTDTGTKGPLVLRGTAATVDDVEIVYRVVDAHNADFDALPAVASGSAGAVPTVGTGTAQISLASGQVILQAGTGTGQLDFTAGVVKANVTQFGGSAGTFAAGRPEVNTTHWGGTAVASANVRADLRQILGTAPTEGAAGRLAGAFTTFFNVASPVLTTASVNQTGDAYALIGPTGSGLTSLPTATQIWTTALTESYRATGATGTGAQLLYEILQNITEFAVSGTTKNVKKLDGTTAKTYTLNDAVSPTSITEAT